MRRTLEALAMLALLAIGATGARAQHLRNDRSCDRYYAVPGQSMRIYPPPRFIYRLGTMTVYSNWPYGNRPEYFWPYSSATRVYTQPWRPHRQWRDRR